MADAVFFSEHAFIRVWSGVLFGIAGMIWCVVPFAWVFGFTFVSHCGALALMGVLTLSARRFIPESQPAEPPAGVPIPIALSVITLIVMISVMMYTQILYPKQGGIFAGPSGYGDLCFHSGIITGLAHQQIFPPQDLVFPDARLTYPFFVNTLSSSLYLLGMPLRWAVLLPSFFMVFAAVSGFFIFAKTVAEKSSAVILAAALFFFNGGLGFFYFLRDPERLTQLFMNRFLSPTNLSDKNIYMWNMISHVLIPQRSALLGWGILFFVLWLLYRALAGKTRGHFLLAGIMTGLLPMMHATSFMAVIVIAIVWALVYVRTSQGARPYVTKWTLFFAPALLLAAPQLMWLSSAAQGCGFLRFHFNWANTGDFWVWFWIKNAGTVFLLLIPALFSAGRAWLRFYSPAAALFLIGEMFLIVPYAPDNNKIFFIWLAFSAILVAKYSMDIYGRLDGKVMRMVLLGLVVVSGTLSGVMTVIQGFGAPYELFSPASLSAGEFVRKATPPDALFVSSDFHNNPVSVLAGRKILCGYHGWLWAHGIDYAKRARDIERMYAHPEELDEFQERYGFDYVFFSRHERHKYQAKQDFFDQHYPRIFEAGDIRIYAVSPRARAEAVKTHGG